MVAQRSQSTLPYCAPKPVSAKLNLRQCVHCRCQAPRAGMIRLLRPTLPLPVMRTPETPPEIIIIWPGQPNTSKQQGRSAYVCLNATCILAAIKRKSFARALKCALPPEALAQLLATAEQTPEPKDEGTQPQHLGSYSGTRA
ncbi:MAG: YlxR family protein [Vampirovibrionales bacterium]|nr:YlxR family protein [Vampirovibrionales bacterium]